MLQELCRTSFYEACKEISSPLVKLRGQKNPYQNFYGEYSSFAKHNWRRVPLSLVTGSRGNNDIRHTRHMAWLYFNENAEKLREHYLRVRFKRSLVQAMDENGNFDVLFEGFYDYFEQRKERFMENTNMLIDAKKAELAKRGKTPQSHGGVANLLKVLTKTMHDQGSSIYTIAKVQYSVCMQAGIYIPDEFLTDVLVAHELVEEG